MIKITQRITNRNSKSINSYFEDVRKIPSLSVKEEVHYATLAHAGDEDAREILIKGNLRFVISVAKQFLNRGVKVEDLINEGNIGLIEAAGKFDPTRGFKFITYAVHYIRRNMVTALKDCEKACKVPHSRIDRMNKLRRLMADMEHLLEREVTKSDLYGTEDFSDFEIDDLYIMLVSNDTSMDQEIGEDGMTLKDTIPSNSFNNTTQDVENDYLSNLLCSMTDKLPSQHREVVSYLHGLNGYELMNMVDLGLKMNLSRQRIDQIYKVALRRLRSFHGEVVREGNI